MDVAWMWCKNVGHVPPLGVRYWTLVLGLLIFLAYLDTAARFLSAAGFGSVPGHTPNSALFKQCSSSLFCATLAHACLGVWLCIETSRSMLELT